MIKILEYDTVHIQDMDVVLVVSSLQYCKWFLSARSSGQTINYIYSTTVLGIIGSTMEYFCCLR